MSERLSAFDLHMHTLNSKDGFQSPYGLFKMMKKKGLRGVAPTEHHRAATLKVIERDGRFIIPACEYKSKDYGEVIGLFVTEHIENRTFEEISDDVHDMNGLVVLPHPMDPLRKYAAIRRGLPDALIIKHVDLIEGINSRCIINLFNKRAQRLAKRLNKPMTAGSDGHSFLEMGHAKTWLQDITSADDIFNELKRGRTQITGYPSIFFLHFPTMFWQRIRRLAYDSW
ncbi:MAG: PHP domain-containing protein [Candidatus Thorarchaeota archaeon]|nr:PHP domain-containing protein [Candidatus Thorarchaeota archaeon]